MKGCLSPPARHISNSAEGRCSPEAHATKSFEEALSSALTIVKGRKFARSAESEPCELADVVFGCSTPKLYERTSIQPWCLSSELSPSTPSNLINASNAMGNPPRLGTVIEISLSAPATGGHPLRVRRHVQHVAFQPTKARVFK